MQLRGVEVVEVVVSVVVEVVVEVVVVEVVVVAVVVVVVVVVVVFGGVIEIVIVNSAVPDFENVLVCVGD